MKVLVMWENSTEGAFARNLVLVLNKIGHMLVHGKVRNGIPGTSNDGVMLEDWQNKPKVKMDCIAAPSGSTQLPEPVRFSVIEAPFVDGYGYSMPAVTPKDFLPPSFTREQARSMVQMFGGGYAAKPKAIEPKPDTKPDTTGVTVRELDLGDD